MAKMSSKMAKYGSGSGLLTNFVMIMDYIMKEMFVIYF